MKKLYIEIADTPIQRAYGLQDRKKLSSSQGMLFRFPSVRYQSFWMKDTYIPLDIAFIDNDGYVFQIETMNPLSTRTVTSAYPCKYALEVNKGWFDKNKIEIGSRIGGEGIDGRNLHRKAQMTPQVEQLDSLDKLEGPKDLRWTSEKPVEELIQPEELIEQEFETPNSPDAILNLTFKQILEDANIRSKKLTIIYQKKDGYVLPPKTISPPFEMGQDEDGNSNSLVTVWDDQDGQWKSFLIDNIIDMEEVK